MMNDITTKYIGDMGEILAVNFIKKQGYIIRAKNYRSRYGEVDIIAEDNKNILFIEVKTRGSDKFGTPAEAVNKTKQSRIITTAGFYILNNPTMLQPRFDIIEIYTDGTANFEQFKINHIKGAFTK